MGQTLKWFAGFMPTYEDNPNHSRIIANIKGINNPALSRIKTIKKGFISPSLISAILKGTKHKRCKTKIYMECLPSIRSVSGEPNLMNVALRRRVAAIPPRKFEES